MAKTTNVRAHVKKKGTVVRQHRRRVPEAPLKGQATMLDVQLSFIVPSTEFDKDITSEEFKQRINDTQAFLSKLFGGETTVRGEGGFVSDDTGQLIEEKVAIIDVSTSPSDYESKKADLESFIKRKQKAWKQESIGYTFEEDLFMYPKFD